MTPILVAPEFLQKVVGFAEATNAVLEKSAADREVIRKAASVAVDALEKANLLKGQKKADVVEGIVTQPHLALELLAKVAEETTAKPKVEQPAATKVAQDNKPVAMGAPAESEKSAKKSGAAGDGSRESDDIWDRGFNFK